jgi:hypothetical protein
MLHADIIETEMFWNPFYSITALLDRFGKKTMRFFTHLPLKFIWESGILHAGIGNFDYCLR